MNKTSTEIPLTYIDHDGARREVRGCRMTVDQLGRHWIWSEQIERNLVYKTKGRENALLAAIDSLLFTIQLKDERIVALQRVHDLAQRFAEEAFPEDDHDQT
jgi:hypothetical protein